MATTLGVEIDFSNGAAFGYPFILDDLSFGLLDENILADQASDIVDVSAQVLKCSTRRGRNRILSNFEAGTATVVLNDPNSDFSPSNTSSPYYGKLLPLRKIRIYADQTYLGDTYRYYIFSGYITSYDTNFYQGTNATATVTLQCVDGFRLLNNVAITSVPAGTAGQTSGQRINTLLDVAGFPSSIRFIDNGDSTMQVDPGTQRNLLQAIQTVEQSEFGAFFMTPAGIARFLSRDRVSKLADTIPKVYTDDGTGLPYMNIDFAYDDQLILNDITVTRVGGTPQQVQSQTSIDKYFVKSGQRSDILVQTDAESLDQASMLLVARENADLRIDSMLVNISGDVDELTAIANLTNNIYTLVNITKTMPGGSSVTRELFIQGIQHDITPQSWNIKLLTAEPIIQAFILDSTNQGILDTNTLSY